MIAAYAFDTVVARMMVVPPDQPTPSFVETFKHIFRSRPDEGIVGAKRIMIGYRGLSARAMEYFINYGITGATSVYVIMAFDRLIKDKKP